MRPIRWTPLALLVFALVPHRSPAQEPPKAKPVTEVRFGCHSNATDADLAALKVHPELQRLDLLSDAITDAGLEPLKSFPKLEVLRLNSSKITDQGLEHVAAIPNLRELVLFRTPVTADGLALLKKIPGLRKLCLCRIPITSECVAQLKELTKLESLSFEQLKPESREKAAELVTLLPASTRITFSR